jgi:integrase
MMTRDRARLIEREAERLEKITTPGMHRVHDGPGRHGLYLQVSGLESRSWLLRYTLHGKARYLGLGSAFLKPLLQAAQEADDARILHAKGTDPLEQKRAQKTSARLERAKGITFREVAEEYISQKSPGWSNAKHAEQWRSTLMTYAYPVLGSIPVQAVDVAAVLDVVRPIWTTRTETASRVRGRIEMVIDFATPQYRVGDNPADWKILKSKLPDRNKIAKVESHAALPYSELPVFMEELRRRDSTSARALEFTILTAARTSEVLGATWDEVDFDKKIWTVPGERMKSGRAHRVPLSEPALQVLRHQYDRREGTYLFPGGREGKPLSNMAMAKTLAFMQRDAVTVHGFRSTFKDWCRDNTQFPNEVSEAALAHVVGDKTEAAYARSDMMLKRTALMDAWAVYCGPSAAGSNVIVPMRVKS